jgi:carboxypeptidase family protein
MTFVVRSLLFFAMILCNSLPGLAEGERAQPHSTANKQEKPAYAQRGAIEGQVISTDKKPITEAIVMTNNGKICHTNNSGRFLFTGMSTGKYAVKAIAAGMEDKVLPAIKVEKGKTASARIVMEKSSSGRSVIVGNVTDAVAGENLYANMLITDSSGSIRWFDINGNPYGGREDVKPGTWHQKTKRYWTDGDFAFSVMPGKVKIIVKRIGCFTETLTVAVSKEETVKVDAKLKRIVNMKELGWFRGDFHAHCAHGEDIYKVNVPFAAFVLRAEGYDWFYLSTDHNNDGLEVDNRRIAEEQNSTDLFLKLNSEYPKTINGHIGNVGITPKGYMHGSRYSNLELIREEIFKKGGIAIPVHPLFGRHERDDSGRSIYPMAYKELPITLLAAPEMIQGIDLYYTNWRPQGEKLWTVLLNKGYRLCCTATSDAALDLGRTPDTMGSTYVYLGKTQPSRTNIIEAFQKGRTSVSWKGASIVFSIDNQICGYDFNITDAKPKKAQVTVYDQPNVKANISIIRNGKLFKEFETTIPVSGKVTFTFDIVEETNAWYRAVYTSQEEKLTIRAATSPFYFTKGERIKPSIVMADVTMHIYDAETGQSLNATAEILDYDNPVEKLAVKDGVLRIRIRPYYRLRVSAEGYPPVEKTIVQDFAPIAETVKYMSPENLCNWQTYEETRKLLESVNLDFPLKKSNNQEE